jgi:hypothetical protein
MKLSTIEYKVISNTSKAKALNDLEKGDILVFVFLSSFSSYANSFGVYANGNFKGRISANVLSNIVESKRLELEVN